MSTLSERLKKAREDAGLTLKKLADESRIQIKYLERLENGEYDKLPAPVYAQGFLKRCAQILGLSPQEILAEYQKELEIAKAIKRKELRQLPTLHSPRIVITPKTIKWFLLALVVLMVAGYLIYQLDFLIAPPQLFLDYPPEDLTISRSSIEVSGRSDPSAKLTINGQQVYIDKDGRFSQEINLSPGINSLKFETVNRFGGKSEIVRQIIVK